MKEPILAWWGLIPIVVFIAVELVAGWPAAKSNATSSEYALSYFVGRLMGGLLISLAIAWCAYRIGGRSRLAGTIAFTVMIGLVCLSALASAQRRKSANRAVGRLSTVPELASFGAFQFEVPVGWMRVTPDRDTTAAMLVLYEAASHKVEGLLKVDVGRPALPTAEQTAQTFAGGDGRIPPGPVSLDGAQGIRVETPSADMSRPRFVVVVYRGEKLYLIMAATANGADVSDGFDHVLKTWRWNDSP